jgi:hypothetical protein
MKKYLFLFVTFCTLSLWLTPEVNGQQPTRRKSTASTKKNVRNETHPMRIISPKLEAEDNVDDTRQNASALIHRVVGMTSDPDTYIKYYIDRQLKLWKQKNEYEDLSLYRARTQTTIRKAKLEELFDKAANAYSELSLFTLGMVGVTLGE